MIGTRLVATFRRCVEDAVDSERFLSAATVRRVGVEDLASFVLVKNAAARQVLDIGCPFRRGPKIVLRAPGGDVLRLERDIEVIVEVAAERGDPEERPAHALAHDFDFLDRRSRDDRIADVVILKVRQNAFYMIDFKRTSDALMLRAGRHHEMLDVKLAVPSKEIGQRQLPFGSVEEKLLLDPNPREREALGRNLVAMSGQGLLVLQKRNAHSQPLAPRYDRVRLHRLSSSSRSIPIRGVAARSASSENWASMKFERAYYAMVIPTSRYIV